MPAGSAETLDFVPDLCSIVVIHYARMFCCCLYFIYFILLLYTEIYLFCLCLVIFCVELADLFLDFKFKD
jgi:hypothetical protein